MVHICSRDWQDFLDKQERIAVALEIIAKAVGDEESLKALTASLKTHDAPLQTALSASAGTTAPQS
jgi:hypothetical protein